MSYAYQNEGDVQIFGTQDLTLSYSTTEELTTRSAITVCNVDSMGGNDGLDWDEDLTSNTGSISSSGNFDVLSDPVSADTQHTVTVTLTDGHNNWTVSNTFTTNNIATTTEAATRVASDAARLNGSVDTLGGNSELAIFFKFGTASDSLSDKPSKQTSDLDFYDDVDALENGTKYYFKAVASDGFNEFEASTVLDFTTYYMTIRGYVYENGTPVERTVRAYIRSDGSFLKETLSDPNDGYYYMNILGSEISSDDMLYVICLDTLQDASYNAIIYDKISAN